MVDCGFCFALWFDLGCCGWCGFDFIVVYDLVVPCRFVVLVL